MGEPDAFFTGDIMDFMQTFNHKSSDLIASAFHVVGKGWRHWWKIEPVLRPNFTYITTKSHVVENLNTLPSAGEGACKLSSDDDKEGVLWAANHVVRMSSRLLVKLRDDLGPHPFIINDEVWAPTVCAAQLKPCTQFDFAPIFAS